MGLTECCHKEHNIQETLENINQGPIWLLSGHIYMMPYMV